MNQENKQDKRRALRRTIFDTVQFTETQSESTGKARISDLSLTGCYIDTINPLPLGTKLRVRLKLRGTSIEVPATVARVEPNMGMGVAFGELTADQIALIEKWLAG
jgi:hypothetical protein